MSNKQAIMAVAVAAVAALLLFMFLVREEALEPDPRAPRVSGSPAPGSAGSEAAAELEPEPEPKPGVPKAGPNPVLARLKNSPVQVADRPLTPKHPEAIRAAGQAGTPGQPGDAVQPARPWRIDRDGIKGAVSAALPEVKECYEEWLKVTPNLGGKVTVTFTITAVEGQEGAKVTEVALAEKALGHAPMEGCILSVFEDLRFERPEGGQTKVTYPIVLAGGETDAGR